MALSTECRNGENTHTIDNCANEKRSIRTTQVAVLSRAGIMQILSINIFNQTPKSEDVGDPDGNSSKLLVDDVLKSASPLFRDFLTTYRPSYLDDARGKFRWSNRETAHAVD